MHEMRLVIDQFSHAFDRFRLSLVATRKHIDTLSRLLASYDIKNILERGFSVVRRSGKIVRDAKKLAPGNDITVQFGRGEIQAEVK